MMPTRCPWCGDDPLYRDYHDHEWGVPVHDEHKLFEFILLEGAQAGLSWITILKKRDNYRRAFADFDPERVARFDQRDVERLMNDAGIVRNRLKITAAIGNARALLEVQERHGSFDRYIWDFVDGQPIVNRFRTMAEVPTETDLSRTISKDLKQRGFRFVGPVIVYSHMQATGMVNDHLVDCFRWKELVE